MKIMPKMKIVKVPKKVMPLEINPQNSAKSRFSFFLTKKNLVILAVLLFLVVAWKLKSYFVVATVNGQPVSRFELTDQLLSRFGAQSLDNLINERLIIGGTRQKGIFVTADEINQRVKQIEAKLQGSVTLKDALSAQGLTESMFKRQIEIQVSIEKLFEKEATVSAKDVKDYYDKNIQDYKNATDQAQVNAEIEDTLRQQKIRDLFDSWFSGIRKSANIKKSL